MDSKAFRTADYIVCETGGGCTGWYKTHANGSVTLITNGNLGHCEEPESNWDCGNYTAAQWKNMEEPESYAAFGSDYLAAISFGKEV